MEFAIAMVVISVISILFNVITINLYEKERAKKYEAQNEAIKAKADLDYYRTVNDIKNEVKKTSEERYKKLNSGDVHSRNSYAASILRNDKNDN